MKLSQAEKEIDATRREKVTVVSNAGTWHQEFDIYSPPASAAPPPSQRWTGFDLFCVQLLEGLVPPHLVHMYVSRGQSTHIRVEGEG